MTDLIIYFFKKINLKECKNVEQEKLEIFKDKGDTACVRRKLREMIPFGLIFLKDVRR